MTNESMRKSEKFQTMERLDRAVKDVVREIKAERQRQDRKWGGAEHDDEHLEHDWIAFIVRHAGRAVVWPRDLPAFRAAMVKVGALAVAAIEWADRREAFYANLRKQREVTK